MCTMTFLIALYDVIRIHTEVTRMHIVTSVECLLTSRSFRASGVMFLMTSLSETRGFLGKDEAGIATLSGHSQASGVPITLNKSSNIL